jgi:hypothetical protein
MPTPESPPAGRGNTVLHTGCREVVTVRGLAPSPSTDEGGGGGAQGGRGTASARKSRAEHYWGRGSCGALRTRLVSHSLQEDRNGGYQRDGARGRCQSAYSKRPITG